MNWIKVSDRLPDVGRCVIIPGGCGFWDGENWRTYLEPEHRIIQWEVTYWMSLPEPPEEKYV